ncbi:cytochrome c-type biogenesis protein [Streptococcus pneumoniae]|nr:cytochrome c-type biogenesis protein [Streptococcus pneumoniae]
MPFFHIDIPFHFIQIIDLKLKHFRKLHPYLGILKKVGGFLIIVMGLLVLFGNASILSQLFE